LLQFVPHRLILTPQVCHLLSQLSTCSNACACSLCFSKALVAVSAAAAAAAAAQHSTAQHSTAQHSTAQHSTAQHKHSTSQAQDLCSIHDLRSTAQHMTHLAGSLISSQTYSVQCKSHTSKRQTGDKQSHCLHIIHDHKFHSANAI